MIGASYVRDGLIDVNVGEPVVIFYRDAAKSGIFMLKAQHWIYQRSPHPNSTQQSGI